MDRRKFLGVLGLAGAVAAIPCSSGLALGQSKAASPVGGSTTIIGQFQKGGSAVTNLPDGSLRIVGYIQYSDTFDGYVVQALMPEGVHGQYLIANPDNKALANLAKQASIVTVQGFLPQGSFLLAVQTINGKGYQRH
jgi:hypothetical protein